MTTAAPRLALENSTSPGRARRKSDNGKHPTADPQPSVTRMTVTPALAMNWLDNANPNNRRVSDAHVQRLARDMKSGEWVLTHEGIAFDANGILLDGQHRLWAIVEAETPVEMHIWRDVTRDALMAIDCGKARNLGDILRLSGGHGQVDNAELAVLRAMLGGFSGPVSLTASEAAEALSKHAKAIAFAVEALPRAKRITNATTRAVIARAYYSADHDRLIAFGRMLGTGVVPDEGAVGVVLLRQFLADNLSASSQTRLARYAKTERALVAFLNGEPISRLYAASQEHFPLPEEAARS